MASVARGKRQTPPTTTSVDTGFAAMPTGERIAWISLHALVFLVPIAMSNLTWMGIGNGFALTNDPFDLPKLAILFVCLAVGISAWAIQLLFAGGSVRLTRSMWALLALVCWMALTTVTSVHVPTSVFGKYLRPDGLAAMLASAAVFMLTVQLVDRQPRMRSLTRTLVVSGMLVSFYAVLQYLRIDPATWEAGGFDPGRAFSTLGNADTLGGFMVIALTVSAAMALSEDRAGWRAVYWIATLLGAVALMVTFARAAWIGAFVSLVILGFAAWRHHARMHRRDWILAAVAAAGVVMVTVRSMASSSQVTNVVTRLATIVDTSEGGSGHERLLIWGSVVRAALARPIFGWGPDTLRFISPRFQTAELTRALGANGVVDNAHNYPLQLAVTIGLPGLLLVIAVVGWVLWDTAPRVFARDENVSTVLLAGLWAAVFGYAVQSTVTIVDPAENLFVWLCLGLLAATSVRKRTIAPIRPLIAGIATAAIVIAGCMVVGLTATTVAADREYRLGNSSKAASPAEVIGHYQRAVRLNPYNLIYAGDLGLALEDWGKALLSGAGGSDASQGRTVLLEALDRMNRNAQFVPDDSRTTVFLMEANNSAGLLVDESYYQRTLEIAQRAISLWPTDPTVRLQYAAALADTGSSAEAVTQLEEALRLDPAYVEAVLVLSQVLQNEGRSAEALQVLSKYNAVYPGQPAVTERIRSLESSATTP